MVVRAEVVTGGKPKDDKDDEEANGREAEEDGSAA